MSSKNIDTHHLTITSVRGGDEHITRKDDVLIIVTQAFGPDGDSLVGISDVTFDGYAAVTVGVRYEGQEGLVHLSPFHGDRRKAGFADIPDGARCELFCPVSRKPLDFVGRDDRTGAGYYALYLTPRLSSGDIVALSDIWGDYHSRIVDNFELISIWDPSEDDEGEDDEAGELTESVRG